MPTEKITDLPASLESGLPLEKSWYARLGIQDLIAGRESTVSTLTQHEATLSDDLRVIRDTSGLILDGQTTIHVGEGGTWARVLAFASAKYGWGLRLVKSGTLTDRPDDFQPHLVDAPLSELLRLNKGSSQLASAAVLCGSDEPMPANAPYHLQMSYEAREYWQTHLSNSTWEVRRDNTYRRQAIAWIGWLASGQFEFEPIQPEDYPISRVFNVMDLRDAHRRGWESLAGHESNRFDDLEKAITQVSQCEAVDLRDHRPLIALDWRHGEYVRILHRDAIGKSWQLDQFTAFTAEAREFVAQAA